MDYNEMPQEFKDAVETAKEIDRDFSIWVEMQEPTHNQKHIKTINHKKVNKNQVKYKPNTKYNKNIYNRNLIKR